MNAFGLLVQYSLKVKTDTDTIKIVTQVFIKANSIVPFRKKWRYRSKVINTDTLNMQYYRIRPNYRTMIELPHCLLFCFFFSCFLFCVCVCVFCCCRFVLFFFVVVVVFCCFSKSLKNKLVVKYTPNKDTF